VRDPVMSVTWRVIYRIDDDAIIIGEVFPKKTQKTPREVIDICQRRFARYDQSKI
jgi:phage-related protein